jgi:hypothetical protein
MKKNTLSFIAIIGKLFSFSSIRRNFKQLASGTTEIKFDRRFENNGERWFHIFPDTGEGFLGMALFQLELERARVSAIA